MRRPLVKRPPGTKYKTIVSIDGGGIRGIIPVMVLLKLEHLIKDHLFEKRSTLIREPLRDVVESVDDFDIVLTDYFDLAAGTSIGSLVATYIAARGKGSDALFAGLAQADESFPFGSMELLRRLFVEHGRDVFPKRSLYDRYIRRLYRPLYPSSGLKMVLEMTVNDKSMTDLEKGLLVTSYDLEQDAACSFLRGFGLKTDPYFLRTAVRVRPRQPAKRQKKIGTSDEGDVLRQEEWEDDLTHVDWDPHDKKLKWLPDIEIKNENFRLRDITLASASAPTYFPPAEISSLPGKKQLHLTLADGGVVANNPIPQVLAYAASASDLHDVKDAAILSLGCGTSHPKKLKKNPGLIWWLTSGKLIEALQNGTCEYIQGVTDYWLYKTLNLTPGQYMRIQKAAENRKTEKLFAKMDDVDALPKLEKIGEQLAKDNKHALKFFVEKFIFAK